jgi:hypothetical protein
MSPITSREGIPLPSPFDMHERTHRGSPFREKGAQWIDASNHNMWEVFVPSILSMVGLCRTSKSFRETSQKLSSLHASGALFVGLLVGSSNWVIPRLISNITHIICDKITTP